jgi:hypothetical protein
MPPHPVLPDILRKFRVQLHQLTPNVIMQINKFTWAVCLCDIMSCITKVRKFILKATKLPLPLNLGVSLFIPATTEAGRS